MIKELIELRRDKWARFCLIVPPIIQMLIYGYAAKFEVYHVATAVLDLDHSQESRELIYRFNASGRFQTSSISRDQSTVTRDLDDGNATVAITFIGIHGAAAQRRTAPLEVAVDGTNSNTAFIALGYVNQIVAKFSQDDANRKTPVCRTFPPSGPDYAGSETLVQSRLQRPLVLRARRHRHVDVELIVSLTAFAIVREREMGTLEQIMVSPIRPIEFILGKTFPFFLIGFGEVALVTIFGILWFQVPFTGDLLVLLAGTSLFLLSTLSLGLLISTFCTTQQQAFATNSLSSIRSSSCPASCSRSPPCRLRCNGSPTSIHCVIISSLSGRPS